MQRPAIHRSSEISGLVFRLRTNGSMSGPSNHWGLLRSGKESETRQVEEIQGGNPTGLHSETQCRCGERIERMEDFLWLISRRFQRGFQGEKQWLLPGHFHIKEGDYRGILRPRLIPLVTQFRVLEQRPELRLGQFHGVHDFRRKNPVR